MDSTAARRKDRARPGPAPSPADPHPPGGCYLSHTGLTSIVPYQAAGTAADTAAASDQGSQLQTVVISAKRLNVALPQIDRLLDLRHSSRLDAIERAFAALGREMEIVVKAAA